MCFCGVCRNFVQTTVRSAHRGLARQCRAGWWLRGQAGNSDTCVGFESARSSCWRVPALAHARVEQMARAVCGGYPPRHRPRASGFGPWLRHWSRIWAMGRCTSESVARTLAEQRELEALLKHWQPLLILRIDEKRNRHLGGTYKKPARDRLSLSC